MLKQVQHDGEVKYSYSTFMLRTVFLVLFLFALALPAMAVPMASAEASQPAATDCHGMPTEIQDDDAQQHDGSNLRLHGCIGCIAPQSPVVAVVTSEALPFITKSLPERELTGTVARPIIPPPRTDA